MYNGQVQYTILITIFRPVAHVLAEIHNIDINKYCSEELPSFQVVQTMKSWLHMIEKFYGDEQEKIR